MTRMADFHAKKRAEMGEEAYLEWMRSVRAHRRKFGRFELDYVAPGGRTGPELAAEAGRKSKRGKKPLR